MSHRYLCLVTTLAAILCGPVTSPAAAEEDLLIRFAPNGADVLMAVNLVALMETPAAKEFFKQRPELATELNSPVKPGSQLVPRAFKGLYFAMNMSTDEMVMVAETDAKLTVADVFSGNELRETVGRHVMRRPLGEDFALALVDEHTVVAAPSGTLRAVLADDRGSALSDQMLALRRSVPAARQAFVIGDAAIAAPGVVRSFSLSSEETDRLMPKIRWGVATADVGERITFRASVECRDAETARRLSGLILAGARGSAIHPKTPESLVRTLETLTLATDGTNLSMSIQIEIDTAVKYFRRDLIKLRNKTT
jgi:hypothetical protein